MTNGGGAGPPAGRAVRGARRRLVRLRGRAGPARRLVPRRARRGAGPARPDRLRQDDDLAAAVPPARPAARGGPARRRRSPAGGLDELRGADRAGHPGRAAVPGHAARQRDAVRRGACRTPGLREVFAELGLEAWLRRCRTAWTRRSGRRRRGLSAGEAQLVALARVFLKDPGLVVLDEASSRLDPATERLLEGAIDAPARRPHRRDHRAPAGDRRAGRPDPDPGRGPGRGIRSAGRAGARSQTLTSPGCCGRARRRCWHERMERSVVAPGAG